MYVELEPATAGRCQHKLSIGELPGQKKRYGARGTWAWRALNASMKPSTTGTASERHSLGLDTGAIPPD